MPKELGPKERQLREIRLAKHGQKPPPEPEPAKKAKLVRAPKKKP